MNSLLSDPLRHAEQAIHDGKIQEARLMLIDYIKSDPNYDRAWWLLTFTLTDLNQQIDCLKRVLNLNPAHAQAREWLAKLRKTGSLTPLQPAVDPFRTGDESAAAPEKPVPPPVFSSRPPEKPTFNWPDPEPQSGNLWSEPEPQSGYSWSDPEPRSFPAANSLEETLFPNGQTPASTPPPLSGTTPPVWTLPEDEKPEPPRIGSSGVLPPQEPPNASSPPLENKPKKKPTWIVDAVIISAILCVAVTAGVIYLLSQQAKKAVLELQQTVEAAQMLTNGPTETFMSTWTRTGTNTITPTVTPSETPSQTPTLEFTLTPTPIPSNMFGPLVSMYPPDFTLTDVMTGNEVTISDYRGQPILLFFWSTKSAGSKTEILALQTIYDVYKQDGLVLLAVNAGESAETVAAYGTENGLTFPLLLDPGLTTSLLYDVGTYPSHFFINRNGRISLTEIRILDSTELEWQVKMITRQFPTPTP